MLIKTFVVGQLQTNCYIVTDETTLECAVIDPGAESVTILDYIETHGLKVKKILITHGHFDHVIAVEAIMEETGAEVWMHEADTTISRLNIPLKAVLESGRLQYYAEGDELAVGGLTFRVLETPGHTSGSVTLMCGQALFTGDTLFRDDCGRTDLGGSDEDMARSLKRLYDLEGNYEVYPGHAEATNLDRERRFNESMLHAVGSM